jgi:hypothetical protein
MNHLASTPSLARRMRHNQKDALRQYPQLGSHVFAQRPINGDVLADGRDELARDRSERPVTLTALPFVSSVSLKTISSSDRFRANNVSSHHRVRIH